MLTVLECVNEGGRLHYFSGQSLPVHSHLYSKVSVQNCKWIKNSQSKAELPCWDTARLVSTLAPGLNFPLAMCRCSSESVNRKTWGEELHTNRSSAEFAQVVVLLCSLPMSTLLLAFTCLLVGFLLCHLCVHFDSPLLAWNALLPELKMLSQPQGSCEECCFIAPYNSAQCYCL